jgi:hypothetical protein
MAAGFVGAVEAVRVHYREFVIGSNTQSFGRRTGRPFKNCRAQFIIKDLSHPVQSGLGAATDEPAES